MPEPEDIDPKEPAAEDSGELTPKPSPRPLTPRRGSVGLKIPGYIIQGVIGRGSTGTVYRARQENVDREVALKVLHKELTGRPRMVRRLQREARTTARLAHPHIVSAIDMGRTGDRWWFAMELVDGPSLALKLRQEGRLSEREALRLFIPLCEALVHIWENGVVHRDIKPANILIDRVSGMRLADLGLAFADDDPHLTGSEGTLGTPHYISPEQARDPSSVDIRTDIWSFGATLFHAVCGEPPLRGANVAEVLSKVLYGRVPDPVDIEPDLSRGFSLVLRKCLSRDFERRYQTPRDLLRDLERVRERRRPKVRAASLEPTSGPGSALPRTVFFVGLFGVLFLGAFLLWKRPWESKTGRAVYGPLATLSADLERGTRAPGPLLADLEALRGELPAADLVEWRTQLASARGQRDRILAEIGALAETRFERALEAGDFEGARAVIGDELERSLIGRVGLSLSMVPTEFRLRIVASEQRLERTLESATTRLRSRLLAAFADPFQANVDRLIEDGRWRSAFQRLSLSADELPAELGVDLSALPVERAAALTAQLASRLVIARADLDRRWQLFDAELVRWIELAARDLSSELSTHLEPVNAGAQLRAAFELELVRRGIVRDELLATPAGLARTKLDDAVADLEEYERRVAGGRNAGDREALDSLMGWLEESAVGGAWRGRRYEEVRAYWQSRQQWLEDNASVVAGRWSELEARVAARLSEVELLLELRDRTTLALAQRDGETLDLHISEEVVSPGKLLVLAPGAWGGMSFSVAKQRVYELFVAEPRGGLPTGARLLEAADVIALGTQGMAADRATLAAAFLRYREGDLDMAYNLLRGLQPSPPWSDLASEITRSVDRTRSVRAEAEAKRFGQARSLLATLYFDEPEKQDRLLRDPGRAIVDIERLLSEFGDLGIVSTEAGRLRALKAELRSPARPPVLADFDAAFGAGTAHFVDAGTVALKFAFELADGNGFAPGAWSPDGLGWLSPGDIASDEDLLRRASPRLVLRSPLDIDSGPASCEFTFTEPVSTGDERLIVASVAGFDFIVRTQAGGAESTVIAGARGATKLLADLRSGAGDRIVGALLKSGATHVLRFEFDKRRGRLLVSLDGSEVLHKDLQSPLGKPGSYGVNLRAREQVRLIGVRVVASI